MKLKTFSLILLLLFCFSTQTTAAVDVRKKDATEDIDSQKENIANQKFGKKNNWWNKRKKRKAKKKKEEGDDSLIFLNGKETRP